MEDPHWKDAVASGQMDSSEAKALGLDFIGFLVGKNEFQSMGMEMNERTAHFLLALLREIEHSKLEMMKLIVKASEAKDRNKFVDW